MVTLFTTWVIGDRVYGRFIRVRVNENSYATLCNVGCGVIVVFAIGGFINDVSSYVYFFFTGLTNVTINGDYDLFGADGLFGRRVIRSSTNCIGVFSNSR